MQLIICVFVAEDNTYEIYSKICEDSRIKDSVFIVRDRPWGYREDRLLW